MGAFWDCALLMHKHVLTWTFLISCWQAVTSVRALVKAVLS